jgi:hypothetical protein
MDTSDIEKKYGVAEPESIPALETLCVRVLHREECEFAIGETDGAVIYCKAMMAAQKDAADQNHPSREQQMNQPIRYLKSIIMNK